eukprot:4181258-Amphidinium_carterae.1
MFVPRWCVERRYALPCGLSCVMLGHALHMAIATISMGALAKGDTQFLAGPKRTQKRPTKTSATRFQNKHLLLSVELLLVSAGAVGKSWLETHLLLVHLMTHLHGCGTGSAL